MARRYDDYYEWGMNCRILGYTKAQAAEQIDENPLRTSRDEELFWEGYTAIPTRSHLVEINPPCLVVA